MQIKDYILIAIIVGLAIIAIWQIFKNKGGCRGCEGCQYRNECNKKPKLRR
jgi:hypothetical protein